jgi:uncharacterized protein (DUF1810 family)
MTGMTDRYDLERFVKAQDPVIHQVRRELAEGQKRTHWMWYIFPQLRSLGRSATAQYYGIGSLAEAQAYLRHPILGARLKECTELVNNVNGRSAHQIFGSPDDLKFHSSATLFSLAEPGVSVFREAIDKYFDGRFDARTVEIIRPDDVALDRPT